MPEAFTAVPMKELGESGDLEDRRMCAECTDEPALKAVIDQSRLYLPCMYCGRDTRVCEIREISTLVSNAIESFYRKTSWQADEAEQFIAGKDGVAWERPGTPVVDVIREIAKVSGAIADDIRGALFSRSGGDDPDNIPFDEFRFESSAKYVPVDVYDGSLSAEFSRFESSLKHTSRFFNPLARNMLGSLFNGISDRRTKAGEPVVVSGGPNTDIDVLVRGRVCHGWPDVERILEHPQQQLGPPPAGVASAGRMNAHGISIFYGATTEKIALAEVRAPVGGYVVTGPFWIRRRVRLLSVERLASLLVEGSMFDVGHLEKLRHAAFLRELSSRISRPVPQTHEPLDYLATQALADFLSNALDPPIDGIIYASAQTRETGYNVALFERAATVDRSDSRFHKPNLMCTTDSTASSVLLVPGREEIGLLVDPNDYKPEDAAAVLNLEINQLVVHVIDSVEVMATPKPVKWHRPDDQSFAGAFHKLVDANTRNSNEETGGQIVP